MLKRYQVLLDEWMARHLQAIAKKYDLSFSEIVRWCTSMHVGRSIGKAYPKIKFNSKKYDKEHLAIVEKRTKYSCLDDIEIHRYLSNLYYETRKAIEQWEQEEKKQSSKNTRLKNND